MMQERHQRATASTRYGDAFTRSAARWLCLAASPTFALMALATAVSGAPGMGCSMGGGVSSLGGMVPMYLLMSAFHLAPWLREMSGRPAGPKSIG